MKKRWTEKEIDFLKNNYYYNGIDYCAQNLQRSIESIYCKLHRLNLKLNPELKSQILKESHIKSYEDCDINPELFFKINKAEVAYFLGFLWADGHLNTNNNSIVIKITKKDADEVINIFSKLGLWKVYQTKPQKETWQSTTTFITHNNHIHSFLSEYDYLIKSKTSPDKILKKIPKNLKSYFYLGLIDGDGCFYINEKKYLYQFCIGSSVNQNWKYMEKLFSTLNIISYSIIKSKNKKGKGSSIRLYNKEEILKLGNFIYANFNKDKIGLQRKYDKFILIKNKCN